MTTVNAPRNGHIPVGAVTFGPEINNGQQAALSEWQNTPAKLGAHPFDFKGAEMRDPMTGRTIKKSLDRESFETGAVRNSAVGKGRFDLLSFEGMRRLALVLEEGAKNYPERNWELGIPVSRCLESALRHIFQYMDGHKDEDHLGQAFWNLMVAVTMEERAEAGRLPKALLMASRADYMTVA